MKAPTRQERLKRRRGRKRKGRSFFFRHRQDAKPADDSLISALGDIDQRIALSEDAAQGESAAALRRDFHRQFGPRSLEFRGARVGGGDDPKTLDLAGLVEDGAPPGTLGRKASISSSGACRAATTKPRSSSAPLQTWNAYLIRCRLFDPTGSTPRLC